MATWVIGAVSTLIAALIAALGMWHHERLRRHSAEGRAKAQTQIAENERSAKEKAENVQKILKQELDLVDLAHNALITEIKGASDKINEAAAGGDSALADAWNALLRNRRGEDDDAE